MQGTNNIDVKAANKANIKRLLFKDKVMTKQKIAQTLKLSLPTVNQNIKELTDENLLDEAGTLESSGGRKPQLINFNYDAKKSIGVEISQKHIYIAILKLDNQLIYEKRLRCVFENTKEYWTYLNKLIESSCLLNQINVSEVLGVGVAIPGTISADRSMLTFAPTLNIKNLRFDELQKYFDLPVFFENEANAAGFSEVWGKEIMSDALYLSITKGVGGAIIINNTIMHGNNGCSGEFGHVILRPGGNACECGRKGCFEAYCSINRLLKDYNGEIEDFFKLVKLGDKEALQLWDQYLGDLALGIHNLRIIFDLDIIIGGTISDYLSEYMDVLYEKYKQIDESCGNIDFIRICDFGNNAAAIGCADMLISDYIYK